MHLPDRRCEQLNCLNAMSPTTNRIKLEICFQRTNYKKKTTQTFTVVQSNRIEYFRYLRATANRSRRPLPCRLVTFTNYELRTTHQTSTVSPVSTQSTQYVTIIHLKFAFSRCRRSHFIDSILF